MIIALHGAQQSGKTESRPVFHENGWTFINLNNIGNRRRRVGGPDRERILALIPDCLYEDGRRKMIFYAGMLRHPELFEEMLAVELVGVMEALGHVMDAFDGNNIVLSWEYLHMVPTQMLRGARHLLLQVDRDVWLERLRTRVMARDWSGPVPSDQMIEGLLSAIGCSQEQIEEAVRTATENNYDVLDTSIQWGEAELRSYLIDVC